MEKKETIIGRSVYTESTHPTLTVETMDEEL